MLGIGLGGFMRGAERGYGLGEKFEADLIAQKKRGALEKIDTEAKTEFDRQQASGELGTDAQFDDFWVKYALPKRVNELLRQGDTEGARVLREWGESEDARAGGRLFASSMFKAQTGDPRGALEDAIKAAKIKGYIGDGYEVTGQEDIVDPEGNLLGFRLKIKMPGGEEVEQDIRAGDVARVVSTFLNPDAAYQSHVEATAAQNKRREELEDYEIKKQIDAQYSTTGAGGKDRTAAIKALRERMDGGLDGYEPTFDDLSREEQEKLIQQEIELQTGTSQPGTPQPGTPARTGQKVIVDNNTGQPVPVPGATGLGASQVPQGDKGPPAQQPIGLDGRQPNAVINGVEDPALPMPDIPANLAPQQQAPTPAPAGGGAEPVGLGGSPMQDPNTVVAAAAQALQQGADPQLVARQLQAAGIPPALWPAPLRQ